MTNRTALIALRDAVVAGTHENDGSMFKAFGDNWRIGFDAYHRAAIMAALGIAQKGLSND